MCSCQSHSVQPGREFPQPRYRALYRGAPRLSSGSSPTVGTKATVVKSLSLTGCYFSCAREPFDVPVSLRAQDNGAYSLYGTRNRGKRIAVDEIDERSLLDNDL